MTITQTVEVPASRRITLDVPQQIPVGPVILTFTPEGNLGSDEPRRQVPAKTEPLSERVFGCAKGQFKMADDFDEPLEDFKDYM